MVKRARTMAIPTNMHIIIRHESNSYSIGLNGESIQLFPFGMLIKSTQIERGSNNLNFRILIDLNMAKQINYCISTFVFRFVDEKVFNLHFQLKTNYTLISHLPEFRLKSKKEINLNDL